MMENIQLVHVVCHEPKSCDWKDNQLLWHIPDDLQHFKRITHGGVIVMGRKTLNLCRIYCPIVRILLLQDNPLAMKVR